MNNKTLLEQLKKLVEIDRALSFDNQNPQLYHQRAIQLQQLGCNALAIYDLNICAFLEKRENTECYSQQYQSLYTAEQVKTQYASESHTHYYKLFCDILDNDAYFLNGRIDPFHYVPRGGDFDCLGLFNLALRDYNDAIKYLKDYPKEYALACLNKALLLNLVGDYKNGWELYEKRWDTKYQAFSNAQEFPRPRWNGENIQDGKLLIYSEQGIGDNFQFVRYAILLKQQGINVLVWNNDNTTDFLKFNLAQYAIETAKAGDAVDFSYWIPMMSLPYICGTTLDNIPFSDAYLTTSPKYLQKWHSKLSPLSTHPKRKIGIVWRGSAHNTTDHVRSIPLKIFAQLFDIDAEFHCLQKDLNDEELELLSQYPNVQVWYNELNSFFDTSAIAAQMDLVISVDTSVAHLCAAMGKNTWILINYKPDFRWLIERTDSPWYRSVHLFRQDLDYNWNPVLEKVKRALA